MLIIFNRAEIWNTYILLELRILDVILLIILYTVKCTKVKEVIKL